jgi:tetratricopeptide (TPR) repeat protein
MSGTGDNSRSTRRRLTTCRPRLFLAGLACLGAAGCSTLSAPSRQPPPASPPRSEAPVPEAPPPGAAERAPPAPAPRAQSDARSASEARLEQSREQRAAGSYPQAAASIERALRIDPNNPGLWLELGEIQLASGNAAQAASLARKALTLSNGDRSVEARAERLLRAASAG